MAVPIIEKHLVNLVEKIYGGVGGVLKTVMPYKIQKNKKKGQLEKKKNLILFVGKIYGHMIDAIRLYEKQEKIKFRIGLIHDSKLKLDMYTAKTIDRLDLIITCDTNSETALQKSLLPHQDDLLAITTRSEDQIPLFAKLIPHLPYVLTPTATSLGWATDKLQMRERLDTYDKKITPKYTIVSNVDKHTLKEIGEKINYPLIVKPCGLGASRLVSVCYHVEELEEVLLKIFKKINGVYKKNNGRWEPKILVEQFIEGEMYSVDAYVNSKGTIFFCPLAHIKTGKSIGFDDFFGYQQITPTLLNDDNVASAKFTAAEAIHAVGLRNTTAHAELLKTESGWRIVEIGPRVGGFRHMMYEFSYGINHTMNDILIRTGKKPIIPKKRKGYTVAMKFFAKHEGKLAKLTGIKKAQELKSFKRVYINKKIGEMCKYAKHGGTSVFNIILFNQDRSNLLADIRRLEQMIEIETS